MENANFSLRKAERKQAKLRIGVSSPSGGGKTYGALLLAKGLSDGWDKIALIDTENGSGELYSHMGDYNVITLTAPFTPERYIQAIKQCEQAGMQVIIIDSVAHEWAGEGGCLDIQDKLGGKFQDWAKVTPRHMAFINSILQSSAHIVTTVRVKQDYAMESKDGKARVQKLGLKEVQRDGFEYELTINFVVGTNHLALAGKDRTGLFDGKPEFTITEATGKLIRQWSESGAVNLDEVKFKISSNIKRLGYLPKTAQESADVIKTLTGLILEPKNYKEIAGKLEVLPTPQVIASVEEITETKEEIWGEKEEVEKEEQEAVKNEETFTEILTGNLSGKKKGVKKTFENKKKETEEKAGSAKITMIRTLGNQKEGLTDDAGIISYLNFFHEISVDNLEELTSSQADELLKSLTEAKKE